MSDFNGEQPPATRVQNAKELYRESVSGWNRDFRHRVQKYAAVADVLGVDQSDPRIQQLVDQVSVETGPGGFLEGWEREAVTALLTHAGTRGGTDSTVAVQRARTLIDGLVRDLAGGGGVEPIAFVDIVAAWDEALKPELPPTVGLISGTTRSLLYDGAFNLLWGSPESGKTYIKDAVIADCLHADRHVIDIDLEEPTTNRIVRRLRDDFGVKRDRLIEYLHCATTKTLSVVTLSPLLMAARGYVDRGEQPPLVTIDSAAKALLGFKSRFTNEELAWSEFYAAMQAFTAMGCCVLTVDHQSDKTPYKDDSTGTYRKRADVDGVSLKVEIPPGHRFTRLRDGFSVITMKKDRSGFLDRDQEVAIFHGGPSGFGLEAPGAIDDLLGVQITPVQERIALVLLAVCTWPGQLTSTNLVNGENFTTPLLMNGKEYDRMISGPMTRQAVTWLSAPGPDGPLIRQDTGRSSRLHPTLAGLNRQHGNPRSIDIDGNTWEVTDDD